MKLIPIFPILLCAAVTAALPSRATSTDLDPNPIAVDTVSTSTVFIRFLSYPLSSRCDGDLDNTTMTVTDVCMPLQGHPVKVVEYRAGLDRGKSKFSFLTERSEVVREYYASIGRRGKGQDG